MIIILLFVVTGALKDSNNVKYKKKFPKTYNKCNILNILSKERRKLKIWQQFDFFLKQVIGNMFLFPFLNIKRSLEIKSEVFELKYYLRGCAYSNAALLYIMDYKSTFPPNKRGYNSYS